jgi:hypothetical protein
MKLNFRLGIEKIKITHTNKNTGVWWPGYAINPTPVKDLP